MKSEPDLDGFKLFLQEEERTSNTIRSYLYSVKAFFKDHPELTKQEVIAWKAELSLSYPASTVNLRLNAIRQYAVFKNILIPVKLMKVQRMFSAENVITDEQYHHLMYCLKSDEEMQWYYNILILAKTGTRISEAVRLKKQASQFAGQNDRSRSEFGSGLVEWHSGHERLDLFSGFRLL